MSGQDGAPRWAELYTPDPEAALAFYTSILGWSAKPDPLGWRVARPEGEVGLLRRGASPARWEVGLVVQDVASARDRLEQAGCRRVDEFEERPDGERRASLLDPSGAAFSLWTPRRGATVAPPTATGALTWAEVNTWQGPEIRDVLAQAFGLAAARAAEMAYWTLAGAAGPCLGVLQMDDHWKGMSPHWMLYFAVNDVQAATERVVAAGGTLYCPPFPTPLGLIGICVDPQGAPFTLLERGSSGGPTG